MIFNKEIEITDSYDVVVAVAVDLPMYGSSSARRSE